METLSDFSRLKVREKARDKANLKRYTMPKTQLNLETVTPMFLHGYKNSNLELRPPPFKALFRYWWRTVQVYVRVGQLQDAEANLFGSTDGRAPFSIRIPAIRLKEVPYSLLPHRSNMDPVPAYKMGQQFSLELITKDGPVTMGCERIAKLAFLLGGVGNRSRRGFGSIRFQDWNFSDVTHLRNETLTTLNDVAGTPLFQINNNYQLNGQIAQIIESTITNFPKYPVIQRIYFGNTTNNIDSLLKNIGQATHNHSHKALGGINPRMASPIQVRIQKVKDQFIPIVTQLNSVFPNADPPGYEKKQQDFIKAVIT